MFCTLSVTRAGYRAIRPSSSPNFPDSLLAEPLDPFPIGADYVTLSPIFLTDSKPGYGPAIGLDALAAAASNAPGPIVALGGIAPDNAAQCLAAGARGIAVMGEIMRAADPEAAIRRLLAVLADKSK